MRLRAGGLLLILSLAVYGSRRRIAAENVWVRHVELKRGQRGLSESRRGCEVDGQERQWRERASVRVLRKSSLFDNQRPSAEDVMSSDIADLILHTPTTFEGSVFQRVSPAGGHRLLQVPARSSTTGPSFAIPDRTSTGSYSPDLTDASR